MSPILSPGSAGFLRCLARCPKGSVSWQALVDRFGEDEALACVNDLRERGFIEAADYAASLSSARVVPSAYRLTISGRDALVLLRRDARRYWITTGIAVLALIVATLSFLQATGLWRLMPAQPLQLPSVQSSADPSPMAGFRRPASRVFPS